VPGSRRNFDYTADDGSVYLVNMDEDNGELMSNPNPTGAHDFLPRNIKPRVANYTNKSGTSSRQIIVSSNSVAVSALPQSITITAANGEPQGDAADDTFLLSFFQGQTTKIPKTEDTGMDDGDADAGG